MRLILRLTVAAIAVWSLPGCLLRPTTKQREDSLPRETKISGEAPQGFIEKRTAFVITGIEGAKVTPYLDNPLNVHVDMKVTKNGKGGVGTATAIDQRGYFLTAAHAVDPDRMFVAISDGSRIRFEKARVVWKGSAGNKNSFDIAIIYAPVTPVAVFEWAAEATPDEEVFAAGPKDLKALRFELTLIHGKIIDSAAMTSPQEWIRVQTTAPVRDGDSGGPLMDAGGKLIGITFLGSTNWHLFESPRLLTSENSAYAVRPSSSWIRTIIEDDVVKHPAVVTQR